MRKTTKIKQKTELQEIRELLGFSRVSFAVIMKRSVCMIKLYEKGYLIPEKVLERARKWKEFYLEMMKEE